METFIPIHEFIKWNKYSVLIIVSTTTKYMYNNGNDVLFTLHNVKLITYILFL